MNDVLVIVILVFLGVTLGSFAGAMVWRIRSRQLVLDKEAGEDVNAKELSRLKKLTKRPLLKDRSVCLNCSYELKWYDLVPVVSWLSLGGKCRSCRQPIGRFEIIIELGLAAFFVASFLLWPQPLGTGLEIASFIIWLSAGVVMAIMFAYDAKWFLLPDITSVLLALLGAVMVILSAIGSGDVASVLISASLSVAIMGGLYLAIYLFSRGAWVGFGDVKLGIGLGLILGQWQLAVVALFLANLAGVLFILPGLLSGKIKRSDHVPFGPFLIIGTILSMFIGWDIINWYMGFLVF